MYINKRAYVVRVRIRVKVGVMLKQKDDKH